MEGVLFMIATGFLLMFAGMGVVFFFLILLFLSIRIIEKCCAGHTALEYERILAEQEAKQRKRRPLTGQVNSHLLAVISAAVAAHRQRVSD